MEFCAPEFQIVSEMIPQFGFCACLNPNEIELSNVKEVIILGVKRIVFSYATPSFKVWFQLSTSNSHVIIIHCQFVPPLIGSP
ncbi:unnamed protein product [Ambrosiozyma monospora]|uniref:Unnamed protein product n=1 Tax=Ambrosiozyma monospora TaxID=43982 RepID=A0ACB5UAT9_AMBMO|nr:unnamed protein product [Ambrosiozyma monospora]